MPPIQKAGVITAAAIAGAGINVGLQPLIEKTILLIQLNLAHLGVNHLIYVKGLIN